ncbi:MAG: glycosyltransferase [Lachnospiraceae bacterium]|nr:glycosyltransferase [Lachnospiraceae bacterium]
MKISVVIPHYNRDEMLVWCLRGLDAQDFPKDEYEVLVVGSLPDHIKDELTCTVRHIPYEKKSDERFPVATLRNMGAKEAKGEVLVFVDCDIVVSEDYLKNYWEILSKEDKFIFTFRRKTKEGFKIHDLSDLESADYVLDEREEMCRILDYKIQDIKSIFFWTYSHSFGMRKDSFVKSGGFYEKFRCWGYEDVDLGYKFYKMGIPIYADDKSKCYHLWHGEENDYNKIRQSYFNFYQIRRMHHDKLLDALGFTMTPEGFEEYSKKPMSINSLYLVTAEFFVRGFFAGMEEAEKAYKTGAAENKETNNYTDDYSEIEYTVRFSECDPYGIAHNSNYYSWFEGGRMKYLSEAGEGSGESKSFVTVKTKCKFIRPCELNDEILIKTKVLKNSDSEETYTFNQAMYRKKSGEILAKCVSSMRLSKQSSAWISA